MPRDLFNNNEVPDKPETEKIIVPSLLDVLNSGESLNEPISNIAAVNFTFNVDGEQHHYGSSITEKDMEIFKLLECETLRGAIPYILAKGNYVVSEENIELYKGLKLNYENAGKNVKLGFSLEGFVGGVLAKLLMGSISDNMLENVKSNLSPAEKAEMARRMEKSDQFKVIANPTLEYTLKKKDK